MFSLLFPWGVLLQALAMVHFIRRRPDTIWLWIIIFLGPLGALVYIGMEVVPDLALLRQSFDSFGRRKRISHLEAMVLQNPSAGNYEELGDLYLEERKYARARDCYEKSISPRVDSTGATYGRGVAALHLGEPRRPTWSRSRRATRTRLSSRDRRAICSAANAVGLMLQSPKYPDQTMGS